jgi:hypothetical protein
VNKHPPNFATVEVLICICAFVAPHLWAIHTDRQDSIIQEVFVGDMWPFFHIVLPLLNNPQMWPRLAIQLWKVFLGVILRRFELAS